MRRDGSTRLGANHKWDNFPAVGAGVNFARLLRNSSFNVLKARVGFGVTGLLPASDGLSQSLLSVQNYGTLYNGAFIPSYGPSQNANPDLRSERKSEWNIGLDFSLNYNLSGSIDYFNRSVKDLLYNYAVSTNQYLVGQLFANAGQFAGSGLEIALSYMPVKSRLYKWTTQMNFAYNISAKLVSFSQGNLQFGSGGVAYVGSPGSPCFCSVNYERLAEGQPIGQIYGFTYAGPNTDPSRGSLGYPTFYKADGSVDLGARLDPAKDGVALGHGLPDFRLDWNNDFHFGAFDAGIAFRGVFGFNIINENRLFYEANDPNAIQSYNRTYTKYWDPKLTLAGYSSLQVENGDFLQLARTSVGYTFPVSYNSVFNKIRVYAAGNNLFNLTGYTGVSPEPKYFDTNPNGYAGAVNGANYLLPGVDRRASYYAVRSFSLGVEVRFR